MKHETQSEKRRLWMVEMRSLVYCVPVLWSDLTQVDNLIEYLTTSFLKQFILQIKTNHRTNIIRKDSKDKYIHGAYHWPPLQVHFQVTGHTRHQPCSNLPFALKDLTSLIKSILYLFYFNVDHRWSSMQSHLLPSYSKYSVSSYFHC